jgi:hypothetical protein
MEGAVLSPDLGGRDLSSIAEQSKSWSSASYVAESNVTAEAERGNASSYGVHTYLIHTLRTAVTLRGGMSGVLLANLHPCNMFSMFEEHLGQYDVFAVCNIL